VLTTWSNTSIDSAQITITTDDGLGNRQTMNVDFTVYGNLVTHTLTGATRAGTRWLANYSVDYNAGNIRLLTSPILNSTVNHRINVEYIS
jgi:hypothetical protein